MVETNEREALEATLRAQETILSGKEEELVAIESELEIEMQEDLEEEQENV